MEISIRKGSKAEINRLPEVEGHLETMSSLLQFIPHEKAKELIGHLDTIRDTLGNINTGMEIYKTIRDMDEVVSWGNLYRDAETDDEKLEAARAGNMKVLEITSRLASFAGGSLYGQIIPVVCEMVASTYNILENHAQAADLVWWYEYQSFYDAYDENKFGGLVLEIKKKGATVEQATAILNKILDLGKMKENT